MSRKKNLLFILLIVAVFHGCADGDIKRFLQDYYENKIGYVSPNIGDLYNAGGGTFVFTSNDYTSYVSPFRISKYEITRAQFSAVMGTDPSDPQTTTGASDPVQNVNWYQAIAFCNKLSLREGLIPVYTLTGVDFRILSFSEIPTVDDALWNGVKADWSANGYRLPTEMEWMWAAMGGLSDGAAVLIDGVNTTGYLKRFAGFNGNIIATDWVWYGSDGAGTTHPVGTKLPNEMGLYDMSGNVYEWCWNGSGNLPESSVSNYHGPDSPSDSGRVLKGGGYLSDSMSCSIGNRTVSTPAPSNNEYGFRVVRN